MDTHYQAERFVVADTAGISMQLTCPIEIPDVDQLWDTLTARVIVGEP